MRVYKMFTLRKQSLSMCCLNTFDGPYSLGASGARVFLLIFIYLIFLHYVELKLKDEVGRRKAVGKGFDEQ